MRRAQHLLVTGVVAVMVVAMGAAALAVVGGDEPTGSEEPGLVVEIGDTDEDGVADVDETGILMMDPTDPDSDSDLTEENEAGNEIEDGDEDLDVDGLTNAAELYTYMTNPFDGDSDDDGLLDGEEVDLGTDPLDGDSDDDGLLDGEEVDLGTDPVDDDSDDDGLLDGDEVDRGTDPLDDDSDDDNAKDGDEVNILETDPLDPDSDSAVVDMDEAGNGVFDGDEDFDGDGLTNAEELYIYGSDPLVGDDVIMAGECTVTLVDNVLTVGFDGGQDTFDLSEMETGKRFNHGRVVSTVAKAAPKECHGEIVSAVAQSDWGKSGETVDDDSGEPAEESVELDESDTPGNGKSKNKDKAKGPKNKG